MRKDNRIAVFLDRDGIINREVDNLRKISDLRLLPKVGDAIRELNKNNFLVIVIANQAVIARGWLTEEGLNAIHKEIQKRLERKKARIDAIYYCPHHPNATLARYRKDCRDRKPNVGLIRRSMKDFNLFLEGSFFVGDTTLDIKTAENAGIQGILVQTGYGGKDKKFNVKPQYTALDLMDAVDYIKKHNK